MATKDERKIGRELFSEPLLTIKNISDIIPVRYNGISESYHISSPENAEAYAIFNDSNEVILITVDCQNKDMLIDIM